MKSFGQKSWMLPQPVLIIGTYLLLLRSSVNFVSLLLARHSSSKFNSALASFVG